MGKTSTTTFTCDKDGVTEQGPGDLPPGWAYVRIETTTPQPPPVEGQEAVPSSTDTMMMLLCPTCAAPVTGMMADLKKTTT